MSRPGYCRLRQYLADLLLGGQFHAAAHVVSCW